MRVVFSSVFRQDLADATAKYRDISLRLEEDLNDRVKSAVRTVIRWRGGDHVGPHGFRCRRCRPFPYMLYYEIEADTLYVLGLVHERRHPEHLRERLKENP